MTPKSGLNFRHLLLVGVGLPALLAVINHFLMHAEYELHLGFHVIPSPLLYAFYVFQVGLMSWAAARFLQPWPLRWIVFTWVMLLTDLQLAALQSGHSVDGIDCVATALMAGQFGVFIVWGILGTGTWIWRVPAWIMIGLILWNLFLLLVALGRESRFSYFVDWNALLVLQAGLLTVLCGMLRLTRYSLRVVAAESASAPDPQVKTTFQFGIRDVLIWTTALAVLLAIAKAGDLLTLRYVKQIYQQGFLFVFTIAVASAAMLVVALWAGLGQAYAALRIAVLVCVSLLLGGGLGAYCNIIGKPLANSTNAPFWIIHFYLAGYWWLAWMLLSGALLASSLLIFRTLGYRLVRDARRRRTPVTAATP